MRLFTVKSTNPTDVLQCISSVETVDFRAEPIHLGREIYQPGKYGSSNPAGVLRTPYLVGLNRIIKGRYGQVDDSMAIQVRLVSEAPLAVVDFSYRPNEFGLATRFGLPLGFATQAIDVEHQLNSGPDTEAVKHAASVAIFHTLEGYVDIDVQQRFAQHAIEYQLSEAVKSVIQGLPVDTAG